LQAFGTVFSSIVQFTTVFASRDCIKSFFTGILLYKGFTFDTPKYCNCTSDRAANPKVLYVAYPAPLLYIRPLNIYQSYIILYTRSSARSVSYKHLAPLPYYSPSFYEDRLCPTRTNSVSRVYCPCTPRHYPYYSPSVYQESLCPTRTNSGSRVYSTVRFAIPRHYLTYALSIYIIF
jgi:hypothetical protein